MKTRVVVIAALALAMVTAVFLTIPLTAQADMHLPNGPWVDRLVWSEQEDAALALEQIKADEADFFMFTLQGGQQKEDAFESDNVLTFSTFGSVNGLLLNPNEQVAAEPMNPFTNATIREAMNWLIDRQFIIDEILDGFGDQFVVPFHPKEADYFRELDLFEQIESQYQADFTAANDAISQTMTDLGASLNANDQWEDANGDLITITIIARIEDERLDIGNYVGEELEAVGFDVNVVPSPSSDAIPLVYGGDPSIGAWHIYTEGWAFTANVAWDDGQLWVFHDCVFEPFCARFGAPGTYSPPADFDEISEGLAFGQYTSLDERQQWVRDLTPRTMTETNYRMWLLAEEAVFPVNDRVEGAVFDAFGGPWTYYTLKSSKLLPGEPGVDPDTGVGGELQVLNFIAFNDAWNPWTDPGWLYDAIQRRAIGDPGMWLNPNTGLWEDFRVNTEVTTAGPTDRTVSPWTGIMDVPNTAVKFNATNGTWDPVGDGVNATSMVVTSLGDAGNWHTDEAITMDDVIYSISAAFRRCFGEVSNHDSRACTATTENFLSSTLKGLEFDTAANTVTSYIDFWHVDEAEIAAFGFFYMGAEEAPVPWEIQEAALQSIINDDTAIHEQTATLEGKIWLDLGRNPDSIAAVDAAFNAIAAENGGAGRIPLGMGDYITQAEASARYDASQAFRDEFGHWYASNGPFLLENINANLRQTVMEAFRDGYPFTADQWDDLKIRDVPDVTFGTFVDSILAGRSATLDFSTTLEGEPTDPQSARWFVRQVGTGVVTLRGEPIRTGAGEFEVQLLSTETVGLETGSYELVVVVQGTQGSVTESFAFTVTSQLDFFQALFDELSNRLDNQAQVLDDLSGDIEGVDRSTSGLQTLLTAVLALAVIAIVVPAVMLMVILRRLPPGT